MTQETRAVRIKDKYLKTLAAYTHWIAGNFLQPALVSLDESGPTAEEAMFLWETHGVDPAGCSDPLTLQKYMQGKISRDFHITEWRRGASQGLFVPEEFFGALGCRSADEFKGIFGRKPDNRLLSRQLRTISGEAVGLRKHELRMQIFWIKKYLWSHPDEL